MIAVSSPCAAQLVSVGALGGVPLLDGTVTGYPQRHDESRPYLIGPSLEFRLPASFAIEVDAIYRRTGNSLSYQLGISAGTPLSGPIATSLVSRTRGNVWEVPVLGKYYFRPRASNWRPFVGTGWAFRVGSLHEKGSETLLDPSGATNSFSFRNQYFSDVQVGAAFAAGLRYRVGRLNLLPQIRYTRWAGSDRVLNRNEAGVMLGVTF